MSIDNLFFYINRHNGGLWKYTINLVVQSIHILLFFSTFFCARNLYFVKSFEFYHFFLYLCPVSSTMTMWNLQWYFWSWMVRLKRSDKFDEQE